ncbi:MAG: hypothetical protein BA861_12005 [Desulfobacterales bacterium S3730MH5]|nr:MAG: hypothetical protein BA861_12005 [Desulfobacterales bacterium S3730MH5]
MNFSRIWLINIVLALFAVCFGIKAYRVWFEGETTALEMQAVERTKPQPKKKIVKKRIPPESDYAAVVEKNLFSLDRTNLKQEEFAKESSGQQVKVSLKEIILYGVVIMDDYQAALISDLRQGRDRKRTPRRTPKAADRRTQWVRVDDTMGDFRVTDIKKDRILLAEGAKEYEILLYDQNKQKRRVAVKKDAKPTVISTAGKSRAPRPKAPTKKRPTRDRRPVKVNTKR